MNAHADIPTTKAQFCRWIERQEGGTFEWDGRRGTTVMMVDVSRAHARVVRNVLRLLEASAGADALDIAVESFGVDVLESVRFPDVVVEARVTGDARTRRAQAPLLIVEVLSPSSIYVDIRDKPAEYGTLPSLGSYVVLAQDAARAWAWTRAADGTWPDRPEELDEEAGGVSVPVLGLTLPFADLYRGVL